MQRKVAVEAGQGESPSVATITVYFFVKPRSTSLTLGSVFLSSCFCIDWCISEEIKKIIVTFAPHHH